MTRLDRLSAPDIYRYDSLITAHVELAGEAANGVILAAGDSSCGYELFMHDGYLRFGYVYTRNAVYSGCSPTRITAGEHRLGVKIEKTGDSAGIATLFVDDEALAAIQLPEMWPIYVANAGIRCGENRHAPITRAYRQPFVFDQDLKRVIVDIDLP